jgi:UDP-3-O-[3-hydroxymyristoyl] glucosamine N-acyltransferase
MARLVEVAHFLGAELQGNGDHQVDGLATLTSAGPQHISFLANSKYTHQLANCNAAAVLLQPHQAHLFRGNKILLDNPYLGYARLSTWFAEPFVYCGIASSAQIDPTAQIANGVNVSPGVVIGPSVCIEAGVNIGPNCVIGAHSVLGRDTQLEANVTLYHYVRLGQRNLVHASAVLGADGFGFAKDEHQWIKIEQLGGVVTGDDVEIGAGTTIDRGALDDTSIGHGVKLDNQVQIAHNVVIGDHTAIAGCTAIAGSTKIGKHCTIAGACGIVGHLTLADNVHITAMSLVTHSIEQSGTYSSGTGLQQNSQWRRNAVRFKQLEQLARRIKVLEQQLQRQ